MSRPMYENQEDRNNEERIIKSFCDGVFTETGKRFEYHKLPIVYAVDYALTMEGNKTVRVFAEVKRRHILVKQYSSIILSLHKYDAMLRLSELGFKTMLIFEFDDGIHYMDIRDLTKPRTTMNGRKDRGDAQDIEPVVWIPNGLWIKSDWSDL